MVRNRQTAGSREPEVFSRCLRAMVLAASWLATGAAAGQEATLGRPANEPRAAAVAKVGASDGGTDLNLGRLLRLVRPKVSGQLPAPLWSKLGFAYRVARERIWTIPGCSWLFISRGADGLELLASASFDGAAPERDQAACAGSAVARTEVGGHQIRLCPRFEVLSVSAAALVLIHETLHSAGMSENPPDPSGLTSMEINRLVEAGCGH
jgi:hypothetical protein